MKFSFAAVLLPAVAFAGSAAAASSIDANAIWAQVQNVTSELKAAPKVSGNFTLSQFVSQLRDSTSEVATKVQNVDASTADDTKQAVQSLADQFNDLAKTVAGGGLISFSDNVDLTHVIGIASNVAEISKGAHSSKFLGTGLVTIILDSVGALVLGIGIAVSVFFPLAAPIALTGTGIAAGVLFIIAGAFAIA